jgi:hypothetical protein
MSWDNTSNAEKTSKTVAKKLMALVCENFMILGFSGEQAPKLQQQ